MRAPQADSFSAAMPSAGQLVDMFQRTISYLRVSVTDQCNFSCLYCMPLGRSGKTVDQELLSFEEILRIVAIATGMGISKVRLTGGEPLMRPGFIDFTRSLKAISGLTDLRLTTNGVFLDSMARDLLEAGISKVNVSLDSLRPERFKAITGKDLFDRVWAGIMRARMLGFSSVKVNMVVMKGINDDEILDFAKLSLTEDLQVRFIEFMPMGQESMWTKDRYLAMESIKARLAELGKLESVAGRQHEGPARVYRFNGAKGTLGFISPISHKFCASCNRLRLTATGGLRSCLLFDRETDLKTLLRNSASDEEIKTAIIRTVLEKPENHALAESGELITCHGLMSRIGG